MTVYNGVITKISGKCAYEGCNEKATVVACGRKLSNDSCYKGHGHPEPACYCSYHGDIVTDEYAPKYVEY